MAENGLLELTALEALNLISTSDCIGWGVAMLSAGYDSPALRRLAGCYSHEHLADVLPWLEKSRQELKLERPELGALFRPYSIWLAQQILGGQLAPVLGLKRLAQLNYQLRDWDPLLRFFCELDDAADFLPQAPEEAGYLFKELESLSLIECILEECRLFLAYSEFEALPESLFREVFCPTCQTQALPVYRPMPEPLSEKLKRLWQGVGRPREAVCTQCGARELLRLDSQAGRRWWLENSGSLSETE
ncbi:hypothetical protein COW36_17180 [bacterium (Candidatus Blackallbacteria) CG17_big_fil_post_rev_8_21_14_2_50_48_46]|uniref:Uncharacterized protein n=1 Tax=bacterium (Candidatus Blackallbacteria) CG17_big_fil_post_rev_8_21_14_2_50_48_46 TaxID=2014261 RepID=A0A2M7G0B5_9BACT|nr:MAG: hypothetical protein COW64_01550 [bacterium (Candidatus Blackallbacteria) CG18_big_fil_WC_8_21_14_2_50_49_26]PIW15158.1 MAG: hypothetical protein COW36_17180 [bacterium (Candidatus Blackallbacteria) CG17_big_fil_post_rev_8_21_14_2_50_48_46]PIW50166.1 MAG: hypothetical protein COW20_03590 [bacterium (Candidatus Blackallbacteria) CG13_big_fil_rev_8_21_14_2_50_49_14]